MYIANIVTSSNVAENFNVVIEIAAHGHPIKYELDKVSGALVVDRLLGTSMHYPCNYGFIPGSLAEDGDPIDVLVITPYPLMPGVVICCRTIGVLNMTDEAGPDSKIVAVPISKITPHYDNINTVLDLSPSLLLAIEHFFAHYKDLEANKWVKIDGWDGVDAAHQAIISSVNRYLVNMQQ